MKQRSFSLFFYFAVILFSLTAYTCGIYGQGKSSIPNVRAGNMNSDRKSDSITKNSEAISPSVSDYFVKSVNIAGHPENNKGGLSDEIEIVIDSLKKMLDGYKQEQWNHFELYIDGKKLKGLYGEPQILNNTFRYKLTRTDSSSEGWQSILNKPNFFDRTKLVNITVGYNGLILGTKTDKNFELVFFKPFNLILFFVGLIFFGFLIWYLGKSTAMLREAGLENMEPMIKPYSLAFVQMTFWFFLVVSSTLMLWLITREFPIITGSVLILMGVSAVTALSSASVNINKKIETESNYLQLNAEDKMLKSRITELEDKLKTMSDGVEKKQVQTEWEEKTKRLNELTVLIPQLPALKKIYTTKGFWRDLVTEEGNVSLNRFQIGVWTIVLGSYFIFCVWSNLALPQFNETLLELMGISSGTYIGFKIQTNKT